MKDLITMKEAFSEALTECLGALWRWVYESRAA